MQRLLCRAALKNATRVPQRSVQRAFMLISLTLALCGACAAHEVGQLRPLLDSVVYDPTTNTATAWFGYVNIASYDETVHLGTSNMFSPGPIYRGQPIVFQRGEHHNVFSVTYDVSQYTDLQWNLYDFDVPLTVHTGLLLADQLRDALAATKQQKAQIESALNTGVSSIEQDLRLALKDPAFTISGATPLQRFQTLIQAIRGLKAGARRELYTNLGGRR